VDGTTESGDDARRHGRAARNSERVADRDHRVTDLERVGIAELHGRETGAVDLDDGKVLRAVLADDAAAHRITVAQRHDQLRRCGSGFRVRDVRVGDNVPGMVEHHSGPEALGGADQHHRGQHLADDIRVAGARVTSDWGGDGGRGDGGRRGGGGGGGGGGGWIIGSQI